MKAFVIDEKKEMGDLTHLREATDIPKPAAKGQDIVVKIKAVATNPIDYKVLGMGGPCELDDPLTVGYDAAGIVDSVGPDTTIFKEGDEVFFSGSMTRAGTFAEYTAVDERIVGKKPSNLSWSKAAAMPLTTLAAWEAMVDKLHIPVDKEANAGKTILITAAAGGVGSIATQIAKNVLGLTVIGTASRPETEAYAKDRGCDYIVSHRSEYKPQLEELGIDGVDYVLNLSVLKPEIIDQYADIVKPYGAIASILAEVVVDLQVLFVKSISFCPVLMFTRPMFGVDMERQNEILNEASNLLDEGVLESTETETFELTLENLKKALEMQQSGKGIGKTTLSFSE